jgi:hypothetical protein
MKRIAFITILCACMSVPVLADITVNVPGTSCVYFAGQTTTVPLTGSGPWSFFEVDRADADTLPVYVDIIGLGNTISITASGLWDHTPDVSAGSGPGGTIGEVYATDTDYDDLGISLMTGAPVNMLLGTFLTDAAPSAPAPAALTYGDVMTSPLLNQTFAIGDALEGINVPVGATRLFLGLNNGWEWTNNSGSVDVTVVPVPGAVLLGVLGLGAVGIKLRKYA